VYEVLVLTHKLKKKKIYNKTKRDTYTILQQEAKITGIRTRGRGKGRKGKCERETANGL
jgi:hypothetical protein